MGQSIQVLSYQDCLLNQHSCLRAGKSDMWHGTLTRPRCSLLRCHLTIELTSRCCSEQYDPYPWPHGDWLWCGGYIWGIICNCWCFSSAKATTCYDWFHGLSIRDSFYGRTTDWRSLDRLSDLAVVVSCSCSIARVKLLTKSLNPYSLFINLPCGGLAVACIIFFFRVPDTIKPAEATMKEKLLQVDIPGFLSITAVVVRYLLALQWGGVLKSWNSSHVVGTLIGFGLLLIGFLVIEWWQGERALLLPSVSKNRTIAHGCAFCFLYFFQHLTFYSFF